MKYPSVDQSLKIDILKFETVSGLFFALRVIEWKRQHQWLTYLEHSTVPETFSAVLVSLLFEICFSPDEKPILAQIGTGIRFWVETKEIVRRGKKMTYFS